MIVLSKYFNINDKEILLSVQLIANKNILEIISPAIVFQTAIGCLMIVSPPLSIKLIAEISKASTKNIRLQMDNLNLEINFLKSQLNPHFLFNTLNNIYSLSVRNDSRAADLVLQLSDMMRYTLYESNLEKVELTKEIDFLYNYIELERVRFGKKVDIDFLLDRPSTEGYHITPLLTFPFIENVFKHGLDTCETTPWLKVSAHVREDVLFFEIANSKVKNTVFKKDNKIIPGGIGIENTRKRLSLLYPDKHTFSIKNNEESFYITMNLNLV